MHRNQMFRMIRVATVVLLPLVGVLGLQGPATGASDAYHYVEICKKGGVGVTGNFTFSIYDPPTQTTATLVVPVNGACAKTMISAGSEPVVTEAAVAGTKVTSITATGSGSSAIWTDLANRSIKTTFPGVAPRTVTVTYTNVQAPKDEGSNGTTIGAVASGGTLKLCKVAGPNVAVGTPFPFAVDGTPITVTAGPAPGGYCKVVPDVFEIGADVTVQETPPSGINVTGIAVTPASSVVSSNVGAGKAVVHMGAGVTEATFTNGKGKTGWIEICKEMTPVPPGPVPNFQFTVPGTSLGTISVPPGSCSPAIEVAAGQATITEVAQPPYVHVGCLTLPASRLVACNTTARTATVSVVAGAPADMTIVTFDNRKG